MHFLDIKEQEKKNMMPTYGRFEVAIVKGKALLHRTAKENLILILQAVLVSMPLVFVMINGLLLLQSRLPHYSIFPICITILRRPIWLKNFVNYPVSVKCFSAIPVRKQMNALLN